MGIMGNMKIIDIPFGVTDWASLPAGEHKGEAGTSFRRTVESGSLRVRMVEYSPGFRADHWCARGHVLLVLEGELGVSLRDGRDFLLLPGMSFQTGDDKRAPHLIHTAKGAKVFLVD
jgi:quercetin dioxygenase-like cupin family protein